MLALIAIVVLLALSILLTVDNSWMNVLQAVRNNVVFANHNKAYGAFVLRRDYNKRLGLALACAIGFMIVAVGTPFVLNKLGSGEEEVEKKKKIVDVNLELFEEQPEEPPPTQNELQETTAGTTTQEGENIDAPPPPPPVEEETFDLAAVQEQPEFPGGMEKMYEFMQRTQKYPDMEYEAGIQGKVYVQFTVAKDGSIEEAKVLRSVSDGLDKEALRLVKSMPKWSPGKMGGKAVKCRFNLPVVFKLK